MAHRNIFKGLLNYLMQDASIMNRARKIGANPELSETSKKMGVASIIFSSFAILIAIVGPFLSKLLIVAGFTTNLLIIGNIFVICFGIAILIIPFQLAAFALSYSRAQRSINNLKIGTVSKHFSRTSMLLSVIFLVVIVFILLSQGK
ncbi:MAG: hypothetical protein PHX09_04255 [Clostridia bacterium]|nr:hypothetical protein [Clostridia bacterium]MDD4685891.1 hypothetical protein [Clostridia bacterium]